MNDPNRQLLAAVLEWTLAMGVDGVVTDDAIDWMADGRGPPGTSFNAVWKNTEREPSVQGAKPATPAPADRSTRTVGTSTAGAGKLATAAPDVAIGAARAAAKQTTSLDALRGVLETFEGCGLRATAKNLSFYRGGAHAPIMIIGEVPGREEDMEGRPFAGRAGLMLDRMMAAAGWGQDDVHITNIVYWRPPGNRAPTAHELEICRPFIERQVELVAPRVLLLMGGSASKQILRSDEGILNIRGRWQTLEFGQLKVPVIATLHPEYLLRTPIAKLMAWRDILSVKAALQTPP
jgi:uracil-DNA glycosylase family 4